MSETRRVLAVGLPSSGKTTFLAALWHALRADEISPRLRLLRAPVDREYLMTLENEWLACEQVGRTLPTAEQYDIQIPVQFSDGQAVTLTFPDLAGETIEAQWVSRAWSSAYEAMSSEAEGLLVFVNPTRYTEALTIVDLNAVAEEASALSQDPHNQTQDWRPETTPTQVQLVEVLQFIMERPNRVARVAVIVSAWDTIADGSPSVPTPAEWLRVRAALLHQFLYSCVGQDAVRVFGVSAQGGVLPRDAARLQDCVRAAEKVRVVTTEGQSHDITTPVAWVVGILP